MARRPVRQDRYSGAAAGLALLVSLAVGGELWVNGNDPIFFGGALAMLLCTTVLSRYSSVAASVGECCWLLAASIQTRRCSTLFGDSGCVAA